MKRLSWFFIVLMGFFNTVVASQGHAATILVFGDSLSAGYGLQEKEDWPTLLQTKLAQEKFSHQVVNASISGETTAGGLSRFATTFAKHRPDIVVLELGANDGLRGLPLKTMRDNLASMIRHSLENNARVLLVSMQIPPNYGKRYTAEFAGSFVRLQAEHPVSLSDFLLGGLAGHPELFQKDGLHPTAEAQAILLNTVWKSLKPLLQAPQ